MLDPTMLHATCRFALADGPLMIEAALPPPFWSFALFNAKGQAIYSLNDRTSGNGGRLEALVLTSEQLAILRENPPIGLEDMIVIETDETSGYALLRAFDGDPLAHKTARGGNERRHLPSTREWGLDPFCRRHGLMSSGRPAGPIPPRGRVLAASGSRPCAGCRHGHPRRADPPRGLRRAPDP